MRLLDIETGELSHQTHAAAAPPYAAVPYCWDFDIIPPEDPKTSHFDGFKAPRLPEWLDSPTILGARSKAKSFGVDKIWIGSLCIDKSSSADLSDAINSMFDIYQNCRVCLVRLGDVSFDDPVECIDRTQWRKRVWVLQELIAPPDIQFYDRDWTRIGTKQSLLPCLSRVLQIDRAALEDSECLDDFSIGRRMSWAAGLSADRPEDVAYSLLGIFGVSIPIIYGEGSRAFLRLQEEISKYTDDSTLFAWQSTGDQRYRGLFARFPSEFSHFRVDSLPEPLQIRGTMQMVSAGLLIHDVFEGDSANATPLLCLMRNIKEGDGTAGMGIPLKAWKNTYVRSTPHLLNISELPKGTARTICIRRDLNARTSQLIATEDYNRSQSTERIRGKKRDTDRTSPVRRSAPDVLDLSREECTKLGTCSFSRFEPVSPDTMKSSVLSCQMTSAMPRNRTSMGDQGSIFSGATTGTVLKGGLVEDETSSKDLAMEDSDYSSDYSSDVSSDSGSESEDLESTDTVFPILGDKHPLARYTDELVAEALRHFTEWPSPIRKRNKGKPVIKKRKKNADVEWDHIDSVSDSEDSGSESGAHAKTRLFACPCQLRNPGQCQNCIKHGGFPTIRHLTRHLLAAHRKPYYCPRCYEIFALSATCDDHIRQRCCILRRPQDVEGLSNAQMKRLSRRPDTSLSREEQWYSIWATIFPDDERPETPYFLTSTESYMRSLRDFWAQKGFEIVSNFIARQEVHGARMQRSRVVMQALQQRVLDRMVDEVIQRCSKKGSG
ncbi:hypothetical protein B0T10DRAFT_606616 [Thelonectria olida]|uniref:Heterokaryon incompatibility domain-containing protein n=1 Tax=Thelonectria olida TaxID=1576542 RepID=A0A9P9AQ59_9HYPO|nr:hypothetical protein B0T10DRAFT_606616 [Thelonectria olida]